MISLRRLWRVSDRRGRVFCTVWWILGTINILGSFIPPFARWNVVTILIGVFAWWVGEKFLRAGFYRRVAEMDERLAARRRQSPWN